MATAVSPRHNPYACVVISGLLLVAAFPHFSLSLLGWVALAPLFAVLAHPWGEARRFLFGFLTGVIFFSGSCYWIYGVMRDYGQLSFPAAAWVFVVFVVGFSLFFGAFGLLAGELAQRWQRGALFLFPFVWVAAEWARTYLPFGGFPWNLLGYTVVPFTGWLQPAAYTGVYGLSFMVAVVNAAVASFWLEPSRRRGVGLAAVALVLAVAVFLGAQLPTAATRSEAVLVQTNLPQLTAPDPAWARNQQQELDSLEAVTREAVRGLGGSEPPVVVWPELPVPLYFHHDPVVRARLAGLAQDTRSFFLTGFVDYRAENRRAEGGSDGEQKAGEESTRQFPYNSAVLLAPDGALIGQYDKIHLVPFGEYLPWANVLGLAGSLVQEIGGFRPGDSRVVLPVGEDRLSVFICYEAIFPQLSRDFVNRGATVLVNISNDGWFGTSAAAPQHLAMAQVRAAETRRFLLRATNTGLTAVIDPYGRVVVQAPQHERTVLTAGFSHRREKTLYVRFGDWFAALCAIVAAAALARKYWLQAVDVEVE